MKELRYLSEDEQNLVSVMLNIADSEKQTLATLFGGWWEHVREKTGFGRRFKRTVEAGLLAGVKVAGRTVQNHQLYAIDARGSKVIPEALRFGRA